MSTGIGVPPPKVPVRARSHPSPPHPSPPHLRYRDRSASPAVGVLIAVGACVAVLMAVWPLMVAFSDVAVCGLVAVAVLAIGILTADAVQALSRRQG